MSYKIRNTLKFLIIIAFSVLFLSVNAYSYAPEGKGDGTGRGKSFDLSLIAIRVEDEIIELEFSKNVTNITVREENKDKFKVRDNLDNEINFYVEIPDDQLEREKRRMIILKFPEKLERDRKYEIEVMSGFKSKNGQSLTESIVKEFKVGTNERTEPKLNEDFQKYSEEEKDLSSDITGKIFLIIIGLGFIVIFIKRRKQMKG